VHRRRLLLEAWQLALQIGDQHVGQIVAEASADDNAQRGEVGSFSGKV
jgi:hypothetical protein